MKKIDGLCAWDCYAVKKNLRIMRITLFLLMVGVLQSYATSTYSQKEKVSVNLSNKSVEEVLINIEEQSEYYFLYNQKLIDVERKVSISEKNTTIDNVLNTLFEGTDVEHQVIDRKIILAPSSLNAGQQQTVKVTGMVTDVNGEPVPGVSIVLKGTTIGTITDIGGKYLMKDITSDGTLVFSFVGMKTNEILIAGNTVINVVMEDEAIGMNEVVVVGYGVQKRSDITGSVTSVPSDRLGKIPVTNVMHAIEGSTAGLNITQSSSVPGSESKMLIRGTNSINASNDPFIVLDGMPFLGKTNDINPNDIESIEILKDASAVAIYGTRGSNGVILITTKRGSALDGKPTITYNGYMGFENLSHKLTPMSPERYVQKYADYHSQNGLTQTSILPNSSEIDNFNSGTTYDWMDEVTRQGILQEHNVSISGGTPNVQYFVSGSYLDQKGVVKGYQYKRTSFRSNLDTKLNEYLKVGTSAFITNNNYDGGRVNFLEANAMSPYSVPYDENGNYIIYPMAPEQLYANPLLGLTKDRLDRGLNITGNGYAELTPKIIKGLKYRLNASYIYNIDRTGDYAGRAANDQSGTAKVSNSTKTNWVIENIISYTRDIDKHHVDFTGLYSAQKVDYFKSNATSKSFINDALSYYDLKAGETQSNDSEGNSYSIVSQMGRVNYSYDSRYLLTMTARRDGYSAFGANTNKYGVFPSIAIGWNIANEDFMSNVSFVQQLKLRLSHGKVGNMAIDPNKTASIASAVQYPFNGSVSTGVLYNQLGNVNLQWESTFSTNLGIDFSIMNYRVSGSIEAYKSISDELLMERNIPKMTGYDKVWTNLGKLQNVGLDVTINTKNIMLDNFEWSTSLNFSTYRSKLKEIYGDGKDDIGNRWFLGEQLGVIYDYEKIGIWQEGEDTSGSDPVAQAGDLKFKDQLTVDTNNDGIPDAADGVITAEDKVIIGRESPKWVGGITNSFRYKNLSMSVFLQISHGGLKSNKDLSYADEAYRRNLPADWNYWTPENKSNYWPGLAAYKNYRGYQFAEDWSFVRIKDITLSYQVPKSFLQKYNINGLTIYASGRNLHTFTNWFGWDPEMTYISRGSKDWEKNYPPVRTISFGVNLTL